MSYANRFSANDFVDKISRIAKRAGAKLVYAAFILFYTLQSDKVSKTDKAIIIGALGYMISPLDVIPDAIPIAGLTDDLAVLIYVLKKVWGDVDPEIKDKAKAKLTKWFDEDEIAPPMPACPGVGKRDKYRERHDSGAPCIHDK